MSRAHHFSNRNKRKAACGASRGVSLGPYLTLKLQLLVQQRGRCFYCGTALALETITIDHLQSVRRGGTTVEGNCVACCSACNREKGSKDLETYREAKGGIVFAGERIP